MGRLKEAWIEAVESGTEDKFLDSFPELDAEDRARIKNLMGIHQIYQDLSEEGDADGGTESVPNQGT